MRIGGTIENAALNLRHDLQRRFHEFETVSKGIKDVNAAISFYRLILDDFIPPVFAPFDKCRKVSHNEGRMRLLGGDKFLSWWSLLLRPLGSTNVNVQCLLVGRPGLDPGTLRVFPRRPRTSISVQICWPDEVQCPPTSTDVHTRLTSWLDSWLDQVSFQVQVTIQFRGTGGKVFDIRLGEE